jgi:hypothetical protein
VAHSAGLARLGNKGLTAKTGWIGMCSQLAAAACHSPARHGRASPVHEGDSQWHLQVQELCPSGSQPLHPCTAVSMHCRTHFGAACSCSCSLHPPSPPTHQLEATCPVCLRAEGVNPACHAHCERHPCTQSGRHIMMPRFSSVGLPAKEMHMQGSDSFSSQMQLSVV